jgi:hypothetical protein
MARKYEPKTTHLLAEFSLSTKAAQAEREDGFVQELKHQRDTALALSPELNAWFGEPLPQRFAE